MIYLVAVGLIIVLLFIMWLDEKYFVRGKAVISNANLTTSTGINVKANSNGSVTITFPKPTDGTGQRGQISIS